MTFLIIAGLLCTAPLLMWLGLKWMKWESPPYTAVDISTKRRESD